ncbi:IS110 family transposase [Chryseobacterium lactis]|uniref:IS110 family transposase n=1 Tax=Chryseobacterium lactis TaxID=1241981 RepID=A0A3G6RJ11_CHRLC|nr:MULTISPECIES: IS110 family transposase [Bacteroidota]AZA84564.1 IS110 family transposase [Chryseobacterium lactis]AZB04952.1 IS110 family transposase [Chryseobacterium lactis]PNW14683.1 IS110 family transposase [Chryseobacterium lactis]SFI56595.1 Transposase [Chryseobacterium indologenes]SUX50677.1 Transposase IS116/IS110/IS902 family [Chryseobacterium indologenes]
MKVLLKQTVGIDVAQNELVVSLGRMDEHLSIEVYAYKVFANTKKGYSALVSWVNKQTSTSTEIRYVMEATGVYHESLAYYLYNVKKQVSIVLPNKISNYSRTLDIKTITDKSASQAIARFGLERQLEVWEPPLKIYNDLKQLCREREQFIQERTMLKNQLHADHTSETSNASSVKRTKKRISIIDLQEKEIREEIAVLIKGDHVLADKMTIVSSIPGIGSLTAVTIIAETNGFELIKNKRQLVSYAGLDVKEKTSGTSVKSKPRISKRGNRYLRKVMHFPALAAIRTDGRFREIFLRLVSKHGIKMKAVVAIQRKLLELTFILWKNNSYYDPQFVDYSIKLKRGRSI